MNTPTVPHTPAAQPKILQRMLLRFAIGLFVLAGLIIGFVLVKGCGDDIDFPTGVDTRGMIAAVKFLAEGSQVGVFLPDGEWRAAPEYLEAKTDRDPVWRPDGNRLFFVGDRGKPSDGDTAAFHVYRWNLGSDAVMQRSLGSTSKGSPSFAPSASSGANEFLLMTSGGFVLSLDPKNGFSRQVLPPVPRDRTGDEEGVFGQFEAAYRQLGTSFREAKWTSDKRFVAAVLRREDGTEVLILQNLGAEEPPQPVVAGAKIEFDVSPRNGDVFYAVEEFLLPDPQNAPEEFKKDGRIVLPFRHAVGVLRTEAGGSAPVGALVAASPDDKACFRSLSVSPDGATLLLVQGRYEGGGRMAPEALMVMPAQAGGATSAAAVLRGQVYEPSWGPDSRTIAFARVADGKRSIFTIAKDGSAERSVSAGKGDFGFPKISPQTSG